MRKIIGIKYSCPNCDFLIFDSIDSSPFKGAAYLHTLICNCCGNNLEMAHEIIYEDEIGKDGSVL